MILKKNDHKKMILDHQKKCLLVLKIFSRDHLKLSARIRLIIKTKCKPRHHFFFK